MIHYKHQCAECAKFVYTAKQAGEDIATPVCCGAEMRFCELSTGPFPETQEPKPQAPLGIVKGGTGAMRRKR